MESCGLYGRYVTTGFRGRGVIDSKELNQISMGWVVAIMGSWLIIEFVVKG